MFVSTLRNYRITILVSVLALFAHAFPWATQWMQLDFSAVSQGQWWRIWTGHLTHFDSQHLFWDLLMFAVLGSACERQHPRRFAAALVFSVAAITAAIAIFCPEISIYRGLSGIDTGLFVWFVADQCRQTWLARDRVAAMLWIVPVAGLTGKLVFEATTGQTLFVDSSQFTPLVESHLAGAVAGLGSSLTMGGIRLHHVMPLSQVDEVASRDRRIADPT